ncbi:transmembrane protein 198-like [Megalops cyprinoides]|uniref:transmembrane protein 198-like n=1 Tax=Megalops cyprinoides TaxID=118141 RepID=UPI001863B8F4|nr:transmembrane protein 198-like [Megalops cyprinoides]XP_036388128.1 transmembrane protein 198-like [Megalops cyprinoides]XP_036388129.1 transmembrane protein 198-like [Megalops cyprinoides]XP_036388130.1 transmembrane protein 198-like [Megalops cyprinoides]XP_036388131.1 transmembrane protein 198-like [Megalops cyprinoides]
MSEPFWLSSADAVEVDACDQEIERSYEVIPAVICSMCCLFGIIYCFFGYRCFKAVMFLSGLMFGSVVIFLLCHKERVLDTQLSVEASAGIGLGIGVLCGLVTMLVRSVGLFLTGLLLGLLLAIAALLVASHFHTPGTVWVPLGVLLGAGMLCAVLALQWQRPLTVLSTAAFGAAILTVCADYFVEMLVLAVHVYDRLRLAPAPLLCWYSWVIVAVWPVLALTGALVQWKLTAEGFSHTEVIISRRQKKVQLMRIRQRDAKKRPQSTTQEPSYRRKPTPVKRYTGDLLAPSYLQSLRDRQMGTGNSLSSLGPTHQTTIDLDYDTGSTVPLTATSPVIRV